MPQGIADGMPGQAFLGPSFEADNVQALEMKEL